MSNPLRHVRVVTTFLLAGASVALLAGSAAHGKKLGLPRLHTSSGSSDAGSHGGGPADKAAATSEPSGAADADADAAATTQAGARGQAADAAPAAAAAPSKPAALVVPGVGRPAKPESSPAATAAAIAASRAEAEKADRASDEGIDDNRDVVKPVLAKHPDSNLVICVAGCGSEPQIVQILPRPPEKESRVVPSSSGEEEPVAEVTPQQSNDGAIVCIAGCKGKRGEVIYKRGRVSWIDPGESEAIRHGLRQIAERLSAELRVIATAEQSQTLTTWSGMGRSVISAGHKSRTLADASAIEGAP